MADYSFTNIDQSATDGSDFLAGLPAHNEYINYINRWKFLINSYLGGAHYKMGNYLTKYVYESQPEYIGRLAQTPLDNHVKSITHIYNSFIYRNEPKRNFGSLDGTAEMDNFLKDCDMEGRTWHSFMRDVNLMSTVYGHCVVLIDRPETVVGTRAEELEQGIRPYATLYTPENVINWNWERLPNGHYELNYLQLLEKEDRTYAGATQYYLRTWTKEQITLETYDPKKAKTTEVVETTPNPINQIPAVWCYASRSPIKGIGVSDIGDVADTQMAIYSELSEVEQLIRLTNHPTLVKTPDVEATAGAGSIITIPNETDAGLRPYLLQPSGTNLDAILKSIDSKIQAIDRMAHMGAIRAIETRQMSGVAMQSEFLLLDAKLCEKAKQLELFEEQFFRIWAKWQGQTFDGEIKYPMAFHIRDKNLDMDILSKAAIIQRDLSTATPNVKEVIDNKILELLAKDEDELDVMMADKKLTMQHPAVANADDLIKHLREMIKTGYTDEEIKNLHPELAQRFGDSNGQETESTEGQE